MKSTLTFVLLIGTTIQMVKSDSTLTEYASSVKQSFTSSYNSAVERMEKSFSWLTDYLGHGTNKIEEHGKELGDEIGDISHDVSESMSNTAHATYDTTSDALEDASDSTSNTAHATYDITSDALEDASDSMSNAAKSAKDGVEYTIDKIED